VTGVVTFAVDPEGRGAAQQRLHAFARVRTACPNDTAEARIGQLRPT
jgi:hypothetical protein